jgi:hypothetical protein
MPKAAAEGGCSREELTALMGSELESLRGLLRWVRCSCDEMRLMPKFAVDESRGGLEKKGDWSPGMARPLRERVMLEGRAVMPSPKGDSDAWWMCDSRRGEPTWPKPVPLLLMLLEDSCRCRAKRALNLLGLEPRGEPTLLELPLGIPRPPPCWVALLKPGYSCSGRDRRLIFSWGVKTSSCRVVGRKSSSRGKPPSHSSLAPGLGTLADSRRGR